MSDPEKSLPTWADRTGIQRHCSDHSTRGQQLTVVSGHPRVALHTSNNGMVSVEPLRGIVQDLIRVWMRKSWP